MAATGELDAAAEEHQAEQARDEDQLADIVADRQTENEVRARRRWSNDSPDQDHDSANQQDPQQAPFGNENFAKARPIHGAQPEEYPGGERQPR